MHLIWSDENKNWSDALIPKQAVESHNFRRLNLLNLPEVDNRRLL
jgi:hypothetical protein